MPVLTAELFAEQRYDFPEGGRWTELVAGEPVILSPPDDAHGNIVRNLSQALADHAHASQQGYACFELGLIVGRNPDTVRCPPVCYFVSGERFAESDKLVTETRPSLVVEIASTNDRRRGINERVESYLNWGAALVWVVDPHANSIYAFERHRATRTVRGEQQLTGGLVLTGFSVPASRVFAEPSWW